MLVWAANAGVTVRQDPMHLCVNVAVSEWVCSLGQPGVDFVANPHNYARQKERQQCRQARHTCRARYHILGLHRETAVHDDADLT